MTYKRENGGLSRNDLVPRWPLYQIQHERSLVPTTVLVRVLTVVGQEAGERLVQTTAGVNLSRSRAENRSVVHMMQARLVAELAKKLENEEMGATR